MAVITALDQVALGVARLISQWQDKPVVVALLTAYLNSVQEIEDVYNQLLTERGLDTAVGSQLDVIGLIVGEDRKGRLDEVYRSAIKLRIAINNSDGTEPVVSTLLKQLSGADLVVFQDVYPAGVKIILEGDSVNVDDSVIDDLKDILAATITAELSIVLFVSPPFVFENDPSGEGFSDNGVGGGYLADAFNITL